MKGKGLLYLLFLILFLLNTAVSIAQITAPGSDATEQTNYPVFNGNDNIYIFCTTDSLAEVGELHAQTDLQGTKTFLWEQYNKETASFEFYFSESTDNQESSITSLADGGYRVTVTQGVTTQIYRAWVFNNWYTAEGNISDSNCESFKLNGSFETGELTYYDLLNNTAVGVFKDVKVEWKDRQTVVANLINPQIFNPPTTDTKYTLHVFDRFGCESTDDVTYESIVTKAKFSLDYGDQDPQKGLEAPFEALFVNESENGDPNAYEWFFFRDLDDIKRESENSDQPIDSIMVVAYNYSPIYTYENSGIYDVKLVSKHVTDSLVCVDTVYIDDYIVVDTSFIDAPNVFNPDVENPDDRLFIVKFWSMQSIKISIFNRWGKKVHFWESNNIRGFKDTYEETVWDGRIGGRIASPGVYYYVVEGIGRDGRKRRAHGFVHLFRGVSSANN